jgi:hypothetical protein
MIDTKNLGYYDLVREYLGDLQRVSDKGARALEDGDLETATNAVFAVQTGLMDLAFLGLNRGSQKS